MTLDEAIEQFKYDAECNRADLDLSYAEDNEQVAEWLEDYKHIKQWKSDIMDSFCKYDVSSFEELVANTRTKAIDDFVKSIRDIVFDYYTNEAYIKYNDLLMKLEQLKACITND